MTDFDTTATAMPAGEPRSAGASMRRKIMLFGRAGVIAATTIMMPYSVGDHGTFVGSDAAWAENADDDGNGVPDSLYTASNDGDGQDDGQSADDSGSSDGQPSSDDDSSAGGTHDDDDGANENSDDGDVSSDDDNEGGGTGPGGDDDDGDEHGSGDHDSDQGGSEHSGGSAGGEGSDSGDD